MFRFADNIYNQQTAKWLCLSSGLRHSRCMVIDRVNELARYAALLDEEFFDDPCPAAADELFDQIYPPNVRELSWQHWTPISVVVEAAKLLVTGPHTRVLDIGCGSGKFCLVAATLTNASFTGIEQRGDLVAIARRTAFKHSLTNVDIIHRNVTDLSFARFDAFYLFNPFEENLFPPQKIDSSVPLSKGLYERYTRYVADQLGQRPIGTRVVTYAGSALEVPACYDCKERLFAGELKLWIKTRVCAPENEFFGSSAFTPDGRTEAQFGEIK